MTFHKAESNRFAAMNCLNVNVHVLKLSEVPEGFSAMTIKVARDNVANLNAVPAEQLEHGESFVFYECGNAIIAPVYQRHDTLHTPL
ncbi:MAG: hypothetical protein K8F33_00115 [Thermomonas sp.]|uniref:hypothetical protein n=1 Tax=Thermomonas sp. TaxID=1971895 RepID=UPI001DF668D9|nr:hypothetical protein [Thermomonas sp.]MBZ0086498.1 hypothetical protein [Thermomonas sp.]